VRFDGGAKVDPTIDAQLRWQAPDGTLVHIDVDGKVSKPKIEFRAPGTALTQGEIVNLLVFGRREAGTAAQQQAAQRGAAAQGAALAQGVAGAVLGGQIQKILPVAFSVSVGAGRYAGGYQWRNVYFELAYTPTGTRLGPQTVGQATARTTLSIEWRFSQSWALITTVGDTGSALVDLLWHFRY
jgi:autotransporter translocation and assembly factor TamB